MLSMYQWLLVFAVFAIIAICYVMSYQRRKRSPPKVTSLLPPLDVPKQELPDYINDLLGRKTQDVQVTTQVIHAAEPLPSSTLTMQGADVDTTADKIIPLDPQMKQFEWATLPENYDSIQEEIQAVKSESLIPLPINIRKKYTLIRPENF